MTCINVSMVAGQATNPSTGQLVLSQASKPPKMNAALTGLCLSKAHRSFPADNNSSGCRLRCAVSAAQWKTMYAVSSMALLLHRWHCSCSRGCSVQRPVSSPNQCDPLRSWPVRLRACHLVTIYKYNGTVM